MKTNNVLTYKIKTVMDISDIKANAKNLESVFKGLKLSDGMTEDVSKTFEKLSKEINKYEDSINKGFKTPKEAENFEKIGQNINKYFEKIRENLLKIPDSTLRSAMMNMIGFSDATKQVEQNLAMARTSLKEFMNSQNQSQKSQIENIENLINKVKSFSKSTALGDSLKAFKSGDLEKANAELVKAEKHLDSFKKQENKSIYREATNALKEAIRSTIKEQNDLVNNIEKLQTKLERLKAMDFENFKKPLQDIIQNYDKLTKSTKDFTTSAAQGAAEQSRLNSELDNVKSRVNYFFSLTNSVYLFRRMVHSAFETVKELDAAMTETAVVTDFSIGDMWEQLPQYTVRANELGATILDVYNASTLFYQQGLKTNEVIQLSNETLKMARIAGMDAAEATNMMTAALRGFNMELNENSAQRINDVYSKLAAITAADTEEIATAMTKTASIASSAGMEFETTAAFLSQIVETTREAPETAGTALKTVIARFSEVKDLADKGLKEGVDAEGEAIEVNKIDKALKTVGISMENFFNGTEGLDSIFLQLAEKWDTLDEKTKKYIATTAAGSRQQSRFIAMMSDYGRTMELVTAANNSAGASQEQFDKTLDSMAAKINKLKNAWNEFTMGIANNELLKTGVDGLKNIITLINKMTNIFGKDVGGLIKLGGLLAILNKAPKIFNSIFDVIKRGMSEGKMFDMKVFASSFDKAGAQAGMKFRDSFKAQFYQKGGRGFKDILNNPNSLISDNNLIKDVNKIGINHKGFGQDIQKMDKSNRVLTRRILLTNTLSDAEKKEYIQSIMQGNVDAVKNKLGKIHLVTIKQVTAATIKRSIAETASSVASTAAATATKLLGAAMDMLPIFAVIAGVTLLVKGFKKLIENTPEKQIERLSETSDTLKEKVENTSQAVKDLEETFSQLDEKKTNLSNLTEGTLEWKKALLEVNEQVIGLLEKYPELSQYIKTESNSALGFGENSEEAYNKILNEANKKAIKSQSALAWNEILLSNKKFEKLAEKETTANKEHAKVKSEAYADNEITEAEKKEIGVYKNDLEEAKYELKSEKFKRDNLYNQTAKTAITGAGWDIKGFEGFEEVVANTFASNNFLERINNSAKAELEKENLSDLREDYLKTFGEKADDSLTKEDLRDVLLSVKISDKAEDKANKMGELTQSLNLGEYTDEFINAIGNKLTPKNLESLKDFEGINNAKELGKALGVTEKELDNFTTVLEEYASELGMSTDKLVAKITGNIENSKWGNDTFRDPLMSLGAKEDDILAITNFLSSHKGEFESGDADLSQLSQEQINLLRELVAQGDLRGEEGKNLQTNVENYEEQRKSNNLLASDNYNQQSSLDQESTGLAKEYETTTEAVEFFTQAILEDNTALEGNKEAAQSIANQAIENRIALDALSETFEKYGDAINEVLNGNEEASLEFAEGMGEIKKIMDEFLDFDVPEDWLQSPEVLEKIREAANGSVDALNDLSVMSLEPMLQSFMMAGEDIDLLVEKAEGLNGFNIEVGTTLSGSDAFIQELNRMVEEGNMTADQANQALNAIGYTPEFGEPVVAETTTVHTITPGDAFGGVGKKLKDLIGGFTYSDTTKVEVPQFKSAKAKGGMGGGYTPPSKKSSGGNKGGGGSKGSAPKEKDPWKNSFDQLYNLIEDIEEEERTINDLQREFNELVEDNGYDTGDILKNLKAQENSLKRQRKLQATLAASRKNEMKNFLKANSDMSKYGTYNWKDNTIEINWKEINKVKDSDEGKYVEEYIKELERIEDSMDKANDAVKEIDKQLEELVDTGKEQFGELEKRVMDSLISYLEKQIESLETVYTTIDEANDKLISNIQKDIAKWRQDRDNEKTEEEISDNERRLSYLQQDTSGGNELEILQLQQQLQEQKESYTDTLIDQKINELEQQNDEAAEQRNRQIDLMNAQLEYDKNNGTYWSAVHDLMLKGMNENGFVVEESSLSYLLNSTDATAAMSEFQKTDWSNELNNQAKLAATWMNNNASNPVLSGMNLIKGQFGPVITGLKNIKTAVQGINVKASSVRSSGKSSGKSTSSGGGGGTTTTSTSGGSVSNPAVKKLQTFLNSFLRAGLTVDGIYGTGTKNAVKRLQKIVGVTQDGLYGQGTINAYTKMIGREKKLAAKQGVNPGVFPTAPKAIYKKGGLADFTGPAWLDGTPSQPEMVLNAKDTKNFIELKNILAKKMDSNTPLGNSGDNYYEIHIEVDEISNDYDVQQLANKVKGIIVSDSMYRNVNSINRLR